MKYGKNLVLFSLFAMNLVDQPTPDVQIDQGTLRGILNAEGTVLQYLGVPYATVNSSNRFQAPLPPPKWEGVYKAYEEYACPQNVPVVGVIGVEDCLRANVYVPAQSKGPLPVMVFIHGGAFVLGSGGKMLYGPEFLVKHDVILVNINYRLGILGFLCLGIKEAPGNAGLKDQIAALRWIKENIAAFGGDPDNITIFGESAGGVSVAMLIASEATDGLFDKAIVQSGSSISSWGMNRNPVWVASLLAKDLGHDTKDPNEIYKIFSTMSNQELVKLKVKKPLDKFLDTQLLHLPCLEKPFPGIEPAIDKLPFDLLTNNKKDIKVIYGSNTKEGLLIMPEETEESFAVKNYRYLFASDLEFATDTEATEVDKRMKQFYFKNDRIDIKTKKSEVTDLYTELYFEVPEIMESELLLNHTETIVYNYIFNYSGGRNFLKQRLGYQNETGACHADELLYLFQGFIWPFRIAQNDQEMIDWLTQMWTNFAKFGCVIAGFQRIMLLRSFREPQQAKNDGKPNPTPESSDLPIRWDPSVKGNINFLHINDELAMGSMPNPKAYELWKDIYIEYRRKDYYSVYNKKL